MHAAQSSHRDVQVGTSEHHPEKNQVAENLTYSQPPDRIPPSCCLAQPQSQKGSDLALANNHTKQKLNSLFLNQNRPRAVVQAVEYDLVLLRRFRQTY